MSKVVVHVKYSVLRHGIYNYFANCFGPIHKRKLCSSIKCSRDARKCKRAAKHELKTAIRLEMPAEDTRALSRKWYLTIRDHNKAIRYERNMKQQTCAERLQTNYNTDFWGFCSAVLDDKFARQQGATVPDFSELTACDYFIKNYDVSDHDEVFSNPFLVAPSPQGTGGIQ